MDRKKMLSNVAFGGDWSDAILGREDVGRALEVLRRAVERCGEEDVRDAALRDVLDTFVARLTRGPTLSQSFWKAAGMPDPSLRKLELTRLLRSIESVVGVEGVGTGF